MQIEVSLAMLLGIGFCVGFLSGLLGIGGGWLVTPALNILGFPMTFAIGTGLAQMSLNSIVSIIKHRKAGNLDLALGFSIGLPMILGVQGGKSILTYLDGTGQSESVTRILYLILLVGLSITILHDVLRQTKAKETPATETGQQPHNLGPQIKFKASNTPISLIKIIILGLTAGVLSGLMGVGGGFVLMPAMMYLFGVSPLAAVATSLICVLISSSYGSLLFSFSGNIDYLALGILFSGGSIGSVMGVQSTKYVQGNSLKIMFAALVFFAAISMGCKQLGYDTAAQTIIFGSAFLLVGLALCYPLILKLRPLPSG